MLELPESHVLARQMHETLAGKTISRAVAAASPHKFAWYNREPEAYAEILRGQRLTGCHPSTSRACGAGMELCLPGWTLTLTTQVRYLEPGERRPAKHQLLVEFSDQSALACTVKMWGGMYLDEGAVLPRDGAAALRLTPYDAAFDRAYLNTLLEETPGKDSVKALLATGQRIPGLGNGVLQDILFHAGLHPKRPVASLSREEVDRLYTSVRETLEAMRAQGGRDTERDLFGQAGGYQTLLSRKTVDKPCPACGGRLLRQSYLGGNIYFCPACQKL